MEGQAPAKKTFKDYEHGFVHIDIKYLPQMPHETCRRYPARSLRGGALDLR